MPKWTKKGAIERMNENAELQRVYERYPLARVLVESAAKLKRYPEYDRGACHYAYKDWMRAAMNGENKAFWTCIRVIDDLLPPDAAELFLEDDFPVFRYSPFLPDLPPRPERAVYESEVRTGPGLLLSEINQEERQEKSEQRRASMRRQLEEITNALAR